jgi:ATP-binding cassette subfamily B multidrug efflux pump
MRPSTEDFQSDRAGAPGAPTLRAVVGSHRIEEEMFGRVFDPRIARRLGVFIRPYRRQFAIAVGAVLLFTLTQLAIPMIIRWVIDGGLMARDLSTLHQGLLVLAAVIAVNYGASHLQESLVGRAAENILFDIRRAMFAHLQRVSL